MSSYRKRNVSQAELANDLSVSQKSVSSWERDAKHSQTSYKKVAAVLNHMFPGSRISVTSDDVASEGLVRKLQEQLGEAISGMTKINEVDPRRFSRKDLEEILTDEQARRILNIDDQRAGVLRGMVDGLREDVERSDWLDIIKALDAGTLDEILWRYQDPDVRRVTVFYKSPRRLTTKERDAFQKLVDEEIEKQAKKERGK